jgi:hypothetical protein
VRPVQLGLYLSEFGERVDMVPPRPEEKVVDEVRHRIPDARVEYEPPIAPEDVRPVVAPEIRQRARPEPDERHPAERPELARENRGLSASVAAPRQ